MIIKNHLSCINKSASFNTKTTDVTTTFETFITGRLATAGYSVLLLEAGGSAPTFAEVPGNVASLQRTALDWQYKTVHQEGVMASTGGQ
jgi:hypothetical protein